MKYNPEIHHRRSTRLRGYDYSQPGMYFVTLCTHRRECLFGDIINGEMVVNDVGKIARTCWMEIPDHYPHTVLDEYIIMPNHVHGIVRATHASPQHASPQQPQPAPAREPKRQSIGTIIGSYKSAVTKQSNKIRNTPGISVWQRNYWEHIIRNEKSLENIRNYIINNPAQWAEDENYPRQKVKYVNQ